MRIDSDEEFELVMELIVDVVKYSPANQFKYAHMLELAARNYDSEMYYTRIMSGIKSLRKKVDEMKRARN